MTVPKARPVTGTARLRWKHEPEVSSAALAGYAGTFGRDLFRIYAPDESDDRWILASLLPGADHRSGYGASADELKPIAERLLEEFVTSLGAVFQAESLSDDQRWQVGEARDLLARWDRDRFSEDGYGAERTLADQLRNMLVIVDHLAPQANPATTGGE